MESTTLQVFLRVLYTVNSNPQYILAKSSSQVQALTCNEGTGYGRAPLKACLTAVCDSSPDLFQNPEKDYSLYVLDPLESQPPPSNLTNAAQNSGSPRGVAVALGFMSWALESNDSGGVHVTGTLTSSPTPSLEVVFALRETKRIHKLMAHPYHPWGQVASAPGPTQPPTHYQPQTADPHWSSAPPVQAGAQEPRTITRSADFPEVYIGPPRRSRGRPEGSTSKSKSKPKLQVGDPSVQVASSSATIDPRSKQDGTAKPKQRVKPRPRRPPPTNSPFICAPLARPTATGYPASTMPSAIPHFYQQPYMAGLLPPPPVYSQAHSYPQPLYNPLLGLLTAISSTSSGNIAANTPEQQAAFLSALQGVLATNPQLVQYATTMHGNSSIGDTTKAAHEWVKREDDVDDGDSDIVILDSSTIDTSAFRKPSARLPATDNCDNGPDTHPTTNQQQSPMPASTPPSIHESTPPPSETSTPSVAPDSTPTPSDDDPNIEAPMSQRTPSGRTEKSTGLATPSLSIPTTPTPSHTRKRKLSEYAQGQAPLTVPDSPSPTVARTSSATMGLVSAMRQRRVQSSPSRSRLVSSPSRRLPSMLDAMRAATASRLQVSSSGSSTQTLTSSTANRNAKQSTGSVSELSSRAMVDPSTVVATSSSSAVPNDGTATKRRRTLNEVMAEQEREREKAQKRTSSKPAMTSDARAPENVIQDARLRPTKSAPAGHTQSSPPRPLFRSDAMTTTFNNRPSASKTTFVTYPSFFNAAFTTAPASASTSASVVSTSASATARTKNPLKNFVLPAWARTSTATLPRLSEEVLARQKAEREAKKAQTSLRRREAAKEKRKRRADGPSEADPSKESSEDEEESTRNTEPRPPRPPSSLTRNTSLFLPPPPPTLPVFASDAVEPIPSSPPPSKRPLPPPIVPSTPPRKRVSLGSGPQHTPGQPGSGSGSLFTPSGSLFTPSTPSISRSLSRHSYTPHSPSAHPRSTTKKSPLKSLLQTPKTPKRDKGKHQTPRSVHASRKTLFASPSSIARTPLTQMGMGMGMRTFLLPPPSPPSMRTPPKQTGVPGVLDSSSPTSGKVKSPKLKSPLDVRRGQQHGDSTEDVLGRELDDAFHGLDIPNQPTHSAADREEGCEAQDAVLNDDLDQLEEGYPSSPLPPSSPPPPTSPFSSPVKPQDATFDIPIADDLVVPGSDALLPTLTDSEGVVGPSDAAWLSDDAATTVWYTDSEANAWLSETEAWLTDTEGGPLLTDSDGAWLSDSDAVFGDMSSSIPPSTASKWHSDDVDTDGGDGNGDGVGAFDAAAFEEAFAALAQTESGRQDEKGPGEGAMERGAKPEYAEFWEAIQPLLGTNSGSSTSDGNGSNDRDKVAQDLRALLSGVGPNK